MKNITRFIALFAAILAFAACVKESDVTTEDTTTEPIEGEIFRVSGTVLDTLGNKVAFAYLKAYFGEVEIETISASDGSYDFNVPISETEGFLVADKEAFSKTIITLKRASENKIERNIYLTELQETDPVDLSIIIDSLQIISGRVVDETGMPVAGSLVFARTLNTPNPGLSFRTHGLFETGADGNFSIVREIKPQAWTELGVRSPTPCGDGKWFNWTDDDPIKDFGDVEVTLVDSENYTTNIMAADCAQSAKAVSYFITQNGFIPEINGYPEGHDLGDVSFSFCKKLNDPEFIYFGAQSDDNEQFNGSFYGFSDAPSDVSFDLCTPSGFFFEFTLDGVAESFENVIYDNNVQTITSTDPDNLFIMARGVVLYAKTNDELILRVDKINSFTLLDASIFEPIYDIEPSDKNYIHYVEYSDTIVAGVFSGKLKTKDGEIKTLQGRFRIPRQ